MEDAAPCHTGRRCAIRKCSRVLRKSDCVLHIACCALFLRIVNRTCALSVAVIGDYCKEWDDQFHKIMKTGVHRRSLVPALVRRPLPVVCQRWCAQVFSGARRSLVLALVRRPLPAVRQRMLVPQHRALRRQIKEILGEGRILQER